ncbi:MAG: hypothetical protein WCI73_19305 [Phycisphaerae bacterium]
MEPIDFRIYWSGDHYDLPAACDNCPWIGRMREVNPIHNLGERIEPGGEVPAGECPQCGALAYVKKKSQATAQPGHATTSLWRCPECHKEVKMTFAAIADVGTPICGTTECSNEGEEMELVGETPSMAELEFIRFQLVDQADPQTLPATGKIKVDRNGIYIAIDGYGEKTAEDGAGTPVGMELYEGKVRVMVWDDINKDDATVIIIEGAKESNRNSTCDDCGVVVTDDGMSCPDGAFICRRCFDAGHH